MSTRQTKRCDPAPACTGQATKRTTSPHDTRSFCTGTWEADRASLAKALAAFHDAGQPAVGDGSWRFRIIDLDANGFELGNELRSQPFDRKVHNWRVGHAGADWKTIRTGSPEQPNPSFEGWPYAKITAREITSGRLRVEISHGSAYQDGMREYLARLVAALRRDGFEADTDLAPTTAGRAEGGQSEEDGPRLWLDDLVSQLDEIDRTIALRLAEGPCASVRSLHKEGAIRIGATPVGRDKIGEHVRNLRRLAVIESDELKLTLPRGKQVVDALGEPPEDEDEG